MNLAVRYGDTTVIRQVPLIVHTDFSVTNFNFSANPTKKYIMFDDKSDTDRLDNEKRGRGKTINEEKNSNISIYYEHLSLKKDLGETNFHLLLKKHPSTRNLIVLINVPND